MTLVGQHVGSGNNVSENSREGLKNGNVDKKRAITKIKSGIFFQDFEKTKNMEPFKIYVLDLMINQY